MNTNPPAIPEPPPPEYVIDGPSRGLGARLRKGRANLCVGDGYYTSSINLEPHELRALARWAFEVASVLEAGILEEPQ